jgi:hypothetical protein
MHAAVELPRNELSTPAHERVRHDKRSDLVQTLASKWVRERGAATALSIGQAQPSATELGFEDTIFFLKVHDDLLLVTLKPASVHGKEKLKNHGRSSGRR